MKHESNYLKERRALKLTGATSKKSEDQDKETRTRWYAEQIKQAPKKCENCNDSLKPTMAVNPTAVVCHIIAKSKQNGVPEVEFHPDNRFYGCGTCHDYYDKASPEEIEQMPVFLTLKKRVANFIAEIPASKLRRVPECLRP